MNALAGTRTMVRLILRRDRIIIPLYVVAFAAFVASQALSSRELYDSRAEREVYATTVANNPAMIALTGPAYAIDTVGGDTAWQVGGFGGAAVAVASMILVGRHTRAEEQSGRSELLRANVLGRYSHPTAALIVVGGANVLLAAAAALALISLDLPTAGSVAFGASMGAVGMVFAAVGVVAAQITENASTVNGIGGAVLGTAYLLRAAGDIDEGTLSWLSPIGWAQRMRPFADERWWPLFLFASAAFVLLAVGYALMSRRDDGSGLLAARPGPPRAPSYLVHPSGLALRLRRGLLIGWTAGLFVGGLAMGSFGDEVGDLMGDSDLAKNIVGQTGGAGVVDSFFATVLLMLAMIGTIFAVQSALRMRSEEVSGLLEPLLATATSRWRWAGTQVLVTVAGVTLVLTACGLGTGISHAVRSGDPGELPRLLGAQLASLPAVLVVGGLAVALFGLVPRAASLAWAALGGCFFIGILGPILELPDWVMDLSPFTHVPKVPSADLSAGPLIWLTVVAATLVAVGLAGFRRRDVG